MKAAILSAGKNRRLASLGIPKGFIQIKGKTLFERTLEALQKFGYEEVFLVIRKDAHRIERFLKKLYLPRLKLTIVRRNSRNPYYSLLALKDCISPDEGILTFNADAYFDLNDLQRFTSLLKNQRYTRGKDMIMWAVDAGGAQDPAFIKVVRSEQVINYGKNIAATPYAFGQIRYCRGRILQIHPLLLARKIDRMNRYIQFLVKRRYGVYIYRTKAHVYDIDTLGDIELARTSGFN